MNFELSKEERKLIVEALVLVRSRISHRATTPKGKKLYQEALDIEDKLLGGDIHYLGDSRVAEVCAPLPGQRQSVDFTCYWCKNRVPSKDMGKHIATCERESPLHPTNMVRYLKEIIDD